MSVRTARQNESKFINILLTTVEQYGCPNELDELSLFRIKSRSELC